MKYLRERVDKLEEEKKEASAAAADAKSLLHTVQTQSQSSTTNSKVEQDMSYVQGLFNGSIELIIFLIGAIKNYTNLSGFIKLTS